MKLSRVLSAEIRISSSRGFGKATRQLCALSLVGILLGCHRAHPPSPSYRIVLQYEAARTRIDKIEHGGKPYIRLQHPAALHSTGKIGSPALPQDVVYVVLPPDARNVRVALEVRRSESVARDAIVEPLQPPEPTRLPFSKSGGPGPGPHATRPIAFDEQTYASSAAFPPEVATLEEVATRYGAKVAIVRVSPFVFYPREKRTDIRTSLAGQITFDSALPTSNLYKDLPAAQREALLRTVINPGALAPISSSAAVAPLATQADYVMPDVRPAKHDVVSYVVITRAALAVSFQPLVDWKTDKGVDARVVAVEWIESRYPGVDLANKVRNFVLDATSKWGTSWFLLGGDVEEVPARICFYDSYTSSFGPSDLYYSGHGGNWNSNGTNWNSAGNHVFGETGEEDLNPDVFVGRAPVQDAAQTAAFVSKVLLYEKNPPAGYVEKPLLMGVLNNLGTDSFKQNTIMPLFPSNFSITRMYDPPSLIMPDVIFDRPNTIAQINLGFHIVNHLDHSGIQSMGTGSKTGGGAIANADVDLFTNGLPGSIVWTHGCDPNAFDYDSISEHWMRNPNGGAVAFVGNTRTGYNSQTSQDSQFFQSWFTNKLRHLGTIFTTTQAGFWSYSAATMNLLGDPEMIVWNAQPTPLTLAGLGAITTGPNPLNLTVSGLAAGEQATVTFRGPGGEVYAGGPTVGGTLTGTLVAHTASTLDLVATSPDRRPLLLSVPVGASTGAHLYVSGIQVIDNTGNGNQQLEPGESAILRVTLENGGGAASAAGTAALATSTAGVTISSSSLPMTVTAPAGSQTLDFPISLTHAFPDGNAILFDLTTNGAGVEHTNVHVPVFAPILEQTHLYDDSAGNGNGIPEAGETVKFGLHVINNGFGDAYAVAATLSANSPAVTITDGAATVGDVMGKGDANSSDTFTLTLGTAFNSNVDTVTLTMTDSLGNSTTQNIKLVVPAPPTGLTYRSTASSITPLWDPAAVPERNYKIYRSDMAAGPYTKIERFLVRDGALYEDATINSTQPSYFYRISIIDSFGNESSPAEVRGWTSLPVLAGFPRAVLPADEIIRGHTVAFDLNGDGKKEIFATVGGHESGNNGSLYAWNSAGNELIAKGDPNFAEFATLDGPNSGAPAFGDLDKDGQADIIVNGKHRVFAFKADGSPLAGWAGGIPVVPQGCSPMLYYATPVVVDLDGDGFLEVVTTAFDGSCGNASHVYVIDRAGAIQTTHDIPDGNYSFATPAVGDLNGDARPELVIPVFYGNKDGQIFVLDTAASSFASIATISGAGFRNEASLADLDGDGTLDIIAASQKDDRAYAVHLDGSSVPGWAGGKPLSAGDQMVEQWSYSSAIAVADLDCDGLPEVVFGSEQHVYVWEHDGTLKSGWPVDRENKTGFSASAASPLIADVNGDGQLDIVISSSTLADGGLIYAWDARTALPINAFPQAILETIARSGAIADLDGDGLLEVIQGAGTHMYAFKTNGRALDSFVPWPNIDRDAAHTSALLASDMSAACCTQPPAGVVAWWPFNETAGTTAADITGGHDGTHHNGPAPVAGMVGGALGFDGVDSYVGVPHDLALDLGGGQFTLDFWIKPDAGETHGTIYRKGIQTSHDLILAGAGFHLFYGNGHFYGFLGGGTSGFQVDFSPNFTHHADPGIWTFVALTVDLPAASAKLYINGQLAQTTPLGNVGSMANTAPVIIGGTDVGPSATRSFAGALDELEFENRVLSLQEVEKIYLAGPAGKCGSVLCLGPLALQVGTGDGYAAFSPDESGGIFSCGSGIGDPNLPGIRFDPPGLLPAANSNCNTALFIFDQAGTRRQLLQIHTAPGNTCPCTFPPAPLGACFYEPLCPPNDTAHITCSDIISDSGVITISAAQKRRITDFTLPNFPGLEVRLIQDVFMNRLEQTYQFTNTSSSTYHLRLSRVAEIDISYVDDASLPASGTPMPDIAGYVKNIPGFVPSGAQIHDNVMTGSNHTPFASVTVTAPPGSDATFEGARLQGNGGSSHARVWWNYGVPPPELNVYGVDGDYWTVTWTGDPLPPSEADQSITVQSLLTIPAGQTKTYITHTVAQ